MYSVPNKQAGQTELTDEGVFWTWTKNEDVGKRDGSTPPQKIQFRYAVVKKSTGDEEDIYFVNILTPVIDFLYKLPPPDPDNLQEFEEIHCYANQLTETSTGDFRISKDQAPLEVSREYLVDLFPELGNP